MRVGVIVNPVAGRRGGRSDAGGSRHEAARAWLAQRRIDAEVVRTIGPGHAAELARAFVARGFDRVVAWGGDGTANEVTGPMVGGRATLGLMRGGSGDGLARGLGVPAGALRALDIAAGSCVRRIDVGRFAGRHFLNVAGVGFDAVVARAFNRRKTRGFWGYLAAGLSAVRGYRAVRCDLDLDGARSVDDRFIVAFANGRQYGNGMPIAPDADPGDGWLDAVVVSGGSRWRQIWRARRMVLSPDAPAEGIGRSRVRRARVSGEGLPCHVDGEPFDLTGAADVEVTPGALGVAVPAGSAG